MILARPPKDWRRPSMPVSVRRAVLERQGRRDAVTGEPLGEAYHFDHRPALWARRFDTETGDTIPPANDPAHIQAISPETHDRLTHGPGGEKRIHTVGSDSGERAKEARLIKDRETFERALLAKASGEAEPMDARRPRHKWASRKIQSRPFEKRKNQL